MKRIITIFSLLALSTTTAVGTTQAASSTSAAVVHTQETTLLTEGEYTTEDGEFVIYSVYLIDGEHLLGNVSVQDRASDTNLMYSIDGDAIIVRGTRDGTHVDEAMLLSDALEIDWSTDPPEVRKKPWKCPGFFGKVICTVGATILEACAQDGEFLGVKCGDGVDGGGTTGGSGGDGDTDTDTDTD